MSPRASLLVLGLIAGAAWTSPASAAAHNGETMVRPATAVANGDVPRLVDVKPEAKAPPMKTAATPDAEKPRPSSLKRNPKQSDAKQKAPLRAKTKAAAAKSQPAIKTKPTLRKGTRAERKPMTPRHPERHVRERERALDAAALYAPRTIERLRRNRTIERAEDSPQGRASGWRSYVDTYANGR